MKNVFWLILLIFTLIFPEPGYTISRSKSGKPLPLSSVHLIDRNGFSETVSNKERLSQLQSISFLDPQPYQKVLRIYARDSKGNIRSVITTYHENGNPEKLLEIVNGRANGNYFEWHENGSTALAVRVIGGMADVTPQAERSWLFDELAQVWDEQGCLKAEIPYQQGVLEGLAVYYHASGQVWKEVPFRGGIIDGCVNIYRATGSLLQRISYLAGKREGASTRYWESEAIASQEEYVKGKLVRAEYCDETGQKLGEICDGNGVRVVFGKNHPVEYQTFVNGTLEGEVKVVTESGSLKRIYHVKEGLKHGEEVEYYVSKQRDNPQPKLSFHWVQGKVQGIARTWYPNGQLESQKEMANNTKNGLLSAWYNDGNLMLIEEYEKQKLRRGDYYKKGEVTPVSQVRKGEGIVTKYDADGHFIQKINYNNGQPIP